ncbi:MAG: L-methionine (R)-S-oxide reductase [Lysobacterales bacterium]|jgi:L-methionine (R)-S-oxide reductase
MNEERQINYRLVAEQAEALLSGQSNRIANAANLSALLMLELSEVNWVGFYFLQDETLILGPFQGKPACFEIPLGQGVCGTAAASGKLQRVANVHEFPGHIACDTASESELVVPLFKDNELIGVLDIDSPFPDRFDEKDEIGLSRLAKVYENSIK